MYITDEGVVCYFMTLVSECDRDMPKALRDRFIETPNEKSIPIQNLRGQGYEGTAMDDNGSKELVD